MFVARSYLEVKVGERVYQLIVPPEAPLQELLEVLGSVTRDVIQLLNELSKAQEVKEEPVKELEEAFNG